VLKVEKSKEIIKKPLRKFETMLILNFYEWLFLFIDIKPKNKKQKQKSNPVASPKYFILWGITQ
jgi:hypothetical protein